MAELADRIPGEIIFAAYANDIRDRAVMRYVDAAGRDASEPLPDTGEMAYLTTTGEFQIYDGTAWVNYLHEGPSPGWSLQAKLDIVAAPVSIETTGVIHAANGSLTDPSYSFASDSQTGMFRAGGSQIGFASGGTEVMRTRGVGLETFLPVRAFDGSPSQPAYTFDSDPDTGMYRVGANILGFVTGGSDIGLFRDLAGYGNNVGANSNTLRNIYVGTTVPDNAWGKDGDVYIRFLA
jgi:hypothetical protein